MSTTAQTNLTEGSVWRQLLRYSWPVILSSVLQSVYSMVDMYIAGIYVGSSGISAITNGGQVMGVVTAILVGLSNGGNIMIGQYFGLGDTKKRTETTGSFFTLFIIIGIGALLLILSLSGPFMRIMNAPSLYEATSYMSICSLGIFFIAGYNAINALLRAVGNSRTPMQIIIASSLMNVGLDILFVGGFGWGVAGAAIATVISQGLSLALALIYLLRHGFEIFPFSRAVFRPRAVYIKPILRLGIPCAIQMSVAGLSWLMVTYLINGYGVLISAASGISNRIKDLSQTFINAMSVAAASMIAQNLGASKFDRAKQVFNKAMILSVSMASALIILAEVFAPYLVGIFTDEADVVTAGVLNLRIEVVGQLFYSIFFIYHALMTGAGHTKMVLLSSFTNCILFRFILSNIFNRLWGVTGVYIACAVAPLSSVPVGYFYYRSNRWRRTLVGGSSDTLPDAAGADAV